MNVPVELVIFVAGLIVAGLGAMFSFNIHLLIRILAVQQRIESAQEKQGIEIQHLQHERVTA